MLQEWVRDNMYFSIAWKMSPISHLKTAATKNALVVSVPPNSPNLMISSEELHGACDCETMFLRRYAVGDHGGAHEYGA